MDIERFLSLTKKKGCKPSKRSIQSFEKEIGATLPGDYRTFLDRCNGGYAGGTILYWPVGATTLHQAGPSIHHIGGLRRDEDYSLRESRKVYQGEYFRIPKELIWVMDDPFGNAICVGIKGKCRGKVYFWDHEEEPDPEDGDQIQAERVEDRDYIDLLAPSFDAFIEGCKEQKS